MNNIENNLANSEAIAVEGFEAHVVLFAGRELLQKRAEETGEHFIVVDGEIAAELPQDPESEDWDTITVIEGNDASEAVTEVLEAIVDTDQERFAIYAPKAESMLEQLHKRDSLRERAAAFLGGKLAVRAA